MELSKNQVDVTLGISFKLDSFSGFCFLGDSVIGISLPQPLISLNPTKTIVSKWRDQDAKQEKRYKEAQAGQGKEEVVEEQSKNVAREFV
jgi:hypothetical protein